ncbi:substrate-binding periplasmic protein [Agarivorans sp. DSG3-1]|uniref:substrate-binding periplasmic protein n=1 Tax=Agarivorans sp. DSG3-1 TaxID=3342249 RepID=UPI00398F4E29
MLNIKPFVFAMLFSSTPLYAHTLEELRYYSEEYFPYNFTEQKQVSGFSIELLALVFKQLGSPMPKVEMVPWARGYSILQQQSYTVLFSTIKTHQRKDYFKWACPINSAKGQFYGLSDSKLKISQLSDAASYKIAVIKGQAIDGYLSNTELKDNLHRLKTVEQAFKLLALRRVDLIALAEQSVVGHESSFKPIYRLFEHQYCFAFNRSISQLELQRFQQALAQVRESAEFAALFKKYFE